MRFDQPAGRGLLAWILALVLAVLALAGCAASPSGAATGASRTIRVVAAENFWGSIAEQLGGTRVQVRSIIDSPDADPHEYEATTADARAIATADVVLINGVGYDAWATKLVAANPAPGRDVLTVGDLVGVGVGGNPHRWYNPGDVHAVVGALTAAYTKIDPSGAGYFDARRKAFTSTGTADYSAVIAQIKAAYAGTPVGASESIFAMVAPSLGLDLITPPDFLKAISEGTEPTAADKATIDEQLRDKKIKVYVYNSQNATPDIQTQIAAAKGNGIPVTTITETMPASAQTWQQWQTTQLRALRDALAKALRR